jgi:integrase
MPKLQLTKKNIDKIQLTVSGQVDYFDTELRGFMLRAGKETKTFYIQADILDTSSGKYKTVKEKIGRFGEWTPDQARKEAAERLRLLRIGKGQKATAVPTLAEMVKTHLADNSTLRPLTVAAYDQTFTGDSAKFTSWMQLPLDQVAAIQSDVIIDTFRRIGKDAGPMAARNAFTHLQTVLNYARLKYPSAVPRNPVSVLTEGNLWPKNKRREDCLRGNEFKIFLEGIQKFNEVTRDATLFCLYQGLRREEATALKWEAVDLDQETITIPTKTVMLTTPLSRQTVAILTRCKERGTESPFVFVSTMRPRLNKSGHISLRADDLRRNTGLDITCHGLRRSFITIGKKLKLHEEVERLVNHVDGSVTGRHYDCRDVEDLREPLQRIASEIERLMVHGVGAKVVETGSGKRAA